MRVIFFSPNLVVFRRASWGRQGRSNSSFQSEYQNPRPVAPPFPPFCRPEQGGCSRLLFINQAHLERYPRCKTENTEDKHDAQYDAKNESKGPIHSRTIPEMLEPLGDDFTGVHQTIEFTHQKQRLVGCVLLNNEELLDFVKQAWVGSFWRNNRKPPNRRI